jgi:hypothetical protein
MSARLLKEGILKDPLATVDLIKAGRDNFNIILTT